jgi:hypothetical protein
MLPLVRIVLAAVLAASPLPAMASAPTKTEAPAEVPESDEAAIALAKPAWESGDWAEVRRILEPVAGARDRLSDPRLRETALLYLADATMSDASLDPAARRRLAGTHIERLLDDDASWRMPPDIYSPELYNLFLEIQEERSRKIDANCQAELTACQSDVRTADERYNALEKKYQKLQADYAEQEVEVQERVARSRFLAAIPFGVGHFYNGTVGGSHARADRALGATFLTGELVIGGVGLGLVLYRLIGDGCRRTKAFQRGSLVCSGEETEGILRRRKAEEAMGWIFIGSIALDIVLAQVRFQKYETVSVKRVKRSELEAGEPDGPSDAPPKRRGARPRAKVRPSGALIPRGAGLGVHVSF